MTKARNKHNGGKEGKMEKADSDLRCDNRRKIPNGVRQED
jgi:hypothetical protein